MNMTRFTEHEIREAYEKRQKLQSGASSAGSEWKDIFNAIMGIPRTFKAGWKAGQKQASESIVSVNPEH